MRVRQRRVRDMDERGRVAIPLAMRKELGLEGRCQVLVELIVQGGTKYIIIRRAEV